MLFRIANAKKVAGSWELSVVSCQISDTEGQRGKRSLLVVTPV